MGIICLYQYGRRVSIQSEYDAITTELEAVLAEIGKADKGYNVKNLFLKNKLVRKFYSEYLKLYLQQKLNERIKKLTGRTTTPGQDLKDLGPTIEELTSNQIKEMTSSKKVKHVNPFHHECR